MPLKRLLILYDSISGNTERMAKFIAEGAQNKNLQVVIKKIKESSEQDLIEADAIAFGCPTYNRDLTSNTKKFFETEIAKIKKHLKGKIGAAFGSYGWSAEALELMKEMMKYLKMNVLELPQEFTGVPDEDFYITSLSDIKQRSEKFGEDLAKKIKTSKK